MKLNVEQILMGSLGGIFSQVNKTQKVQVFRIMQLQLSADTVWNSAQEQLRAKLTKDTYNMWFAPLQAVNLDASFITLQAPNEFCEVWLKDNYISLLQDAVAVSAGCRLAVKFKTNTGEDARSLSSTQIADYDTFLIDEVAPKVNEIVDIINELNRCVGLPRGRS